MALLLLHCHRREIKLDLSDITLICWVLKIDDVITTHTFGYFCKVNRCAPCRFSGFPQRKV